MNARGPQWGVSFRGESVTDVASWQSAVGGLRAASHSQGDNEFFKWLAGDPNIRWVTFLNSLNVASTSPLLRCLGAPANVLAALRSLNINVLAVWHVTCDNLALATSNAGQAEYWRERWELYRWFYLGGRFLAANGVREIEIYNEPDIDAGSCLTAAIWADEYRVRALALRHAYADFASWSGRAAPLTLVGPPASSPRYDPGSFAAQAVAGIHSIFPSGSSPSWWNQNGCVAPRGEQHDVARQLQIH